MQRGRQKCMEDAPRISNIGKMILKCSATITWAEHLEIISKTNGFFEGARVFAERAPEMHGRGPADFKHWKNDSKVLGDNHLGGAP